MKEISGIDEIAYTDAFESRIGGVMTREIVNTLYFDCYRHQTEDLPDYNAVRAREF